MTSTLAGEVFSEFMKKLEAEKLPISMIDGLKSLFDSQNLITNEQIIDMIKECVPHRDHD